LGAPDTALTATGDAFVAGAKIVFDGVALPTTVTSKTSLVATIPAAKLGASGSYPVTITNPAPGGGTSSAIAFIVSNPTVALLSVTPQSANAGASATDIDLVGSGFVTASAVSFNGQALASTTQDAQHIHATVPATALVTMGDFPIVV